MVKVQLLSGSPTADYTHLKFNSAVTFTIEAINLNKKTSTFELL